MNISFTSHFLDHLHYPYNHFPSLVMNIFIEVTKLRLGLLHKPVPVDTVGSVTPRRTIKKHPSTSRFGRLTLPLPCKSSAGIVTGSSPWSILAACPHRRSPQLNDYQHVIVVRAPHSFFFSNLPSPEQDQNFLEYSPTILQ